MDELERRMRDSLARAVDGWEPTAGEVRRAAPAPTRRPLRLAMAVVAVLVVVIGGLGVALGVTGSHGSQRPATLAAASPLPSDLRYSIAASCAGLQFLSESQYNQQQVEGALGCPNSPTAEPLPSPCPSPTSNLDRPAAPATLPIDGKAYSSTLCILFASPSPSASGAPVGRAGPPTPGATAAESPSESPSVTPSAVPACAAGDLTMRVSTDKASYELKAPVTITVTVSSKATCDAPGELHLTGSVTDASTAGKLVESLGECGLHDGTDEKCAAAPAETSGHTVTHWRAGQRQTLTDVWNQATGETRAGQTVADPGSYLITATEGQVSGSGHFMITAPACTPTQLTVALTTDQTSYAQGQTAQLTGTVTNSSATACLASSYIADPIAKDSTGATVWTDCQGSEEGLQSDGSCVNGAVGFGPALVQPGATVVGREAGDSGTHRFTWDLTLTGSSSAHPKPAPDGTYVLSWPGLCGAGLTTATVSITVTG